MVRYHLLRSSRFDVLQNVVVVAIAVATDGHKNDVSGVRGSRLPVHDQITAAVGVAHLERADPATVFSGYVRESVVGVGRIPPANH